MFRQALIALAFAPILLHGQATGKITGRITDAATHQPIPKVHVSCVSGAQAGVPGSGQFVGTLTGTDGSYTLADVPAGRVRMTVNLDGYKVIFDEPDPNPAALLPSRQARPALNSGLTLAAGDIVTRNFEMHPMGRIYGRLVDRDTGQPISGQTVSAVKKEEYQAGRIFFLGGTGDQKGDEFNIQNVEPGDYWIRIDPAKEGKFVIPADASPKPELATCYGPTWYPDVPRADMAATIHVGEGESRRVDISLQTRETHSLTGVAKVPREFESQPVTLALLASSGGLINGLAATMPTPGSFRIDNLAPGTYRLSLTGGKLSGNMKSYTDYLDAEAFSRDKAPNLVAGDYTFEITNRDVDNFKAVLAPYSGISGEVRMLEQDAKLPDRLAVVMYPATDGPIIIRAAPVQSARFHQESLRPGEYWPQLAGLPDGYAVAKILFDGASPRNAAINLTAQDTAVTFVLTSRPGAVAGLVRDEDQSPVRDAFVVLLPDPLPDNPAPQAIQVKASAADGAFIFKNLAPGMYKALLLTGDDVRRQDDVDYLRTQAASIDSFEVQAGQSVTVNLKP